MNKNILNELPSIGCDVNAVLQRIYGDDDFFIELLVTLNNRLPSDIANIHKALDANDCEEAFKIAHMLKGSVINLGMNRMYESVSTIVEDLRTGNITEARNHIPALDAWFSEFSKLMEKYTN